MLRVNLLGEPRVVLADSTRVGLRATMRDQALAQLAYTGAWTGRDRLAFMFWPDTSDETARHNLRQLLKRIRRLPWLEGFEVDDDRVRWRVATDVADLTIAVRQGRHDRIPREARLLPGIERNATVEYADWLDAEREQVLRLWREGLLAAATAADESGDPVGAARLLKPLLAEDDADPALPRYMELAVRGGDRRAALDAYEQVAARLHADLGVEPPQSARELATRLRRVPTTVRPLRPAGVVGRDTDRDLVIARLLDPACRMLTLLGPGGIGKSTLARMVADAVTDRFLDGSRVVELESVSEPDDVPSRIAANLGIGLDRRLDPVGQVVDRLRRLELLLVLDNVEHLPEAWPTLVRVLRRCPGVTLLLTSRERLRLDEEWVQEVEGLGDDDAVALFRQRAKRYADLAVTGTQATGLVRAVGGSPLAIELAASWLTVMTVPEVGDLVRDDPGMLTDDRRDRTARHRSVEAAMAHSWALAAPEERAGVEALSVFAAPYTRALAEEVAGVTPLVLRDLVDKSLVQRRGEDHYASHPLVRQYAAARLSTDDARRRVVRNRHARAVLGVLPGDDAPVPLHLLDDVVLAWQHAVDLADLDQLRDAAGGLVAFLAAAGRFRQALGLLEDAEVAASEDSSALAALRESRSRVLNRLGRHQEAIAVAADAVAAARAAGDRRRAVGALLALAWARKTVGGDQAQYHTSLEALEAARPLGDDMLTAAVLNALGCSAASLEECRRHLRTALDITARDSLSDLRIRLLNSLGGVEASLGRLPEGLDLLSEGLRCSRAANRLPRVVEYLVDLAFLQAEAGDLGQAERLVTEAERMLDRVEDPDQRIYTTVVAGEIHRLNGDREGALTRMREALTTAATVRHEALLLRALRLHGQLLLDAGDTDEALRALAVVMAGPTRKGDYTSMWINPRVWSEATEGLEPDIVRAAQEWARRHGAGPLVEQVQGTRTR